MTGFGEYDLSKYNNPISLEELYRSKLGEICDFYRGTNEELYFTDGSTSMFTFLNLGSAPMVRSGTLLHVWEESKYAPYYFSMEFINSDGDRTNESFRLIMNKHIAEQILGLTPKGVETTIEESTKSDSEQHYLQLFGGTK